MGLIPSRNPWQRRTIHLDADLICVHCQYNLRGLPISGSCPECGGAVWDSFLRKDLPVLRSALRSASTMCWMLAVTPFLMLALMVIEHQPQETEVATVPLAFAWLWCLLWGSCGWRFLSLPALQSDDRQTAAVFTLALLSAICGIIAITGTMLDVPRIGQLGWEGSILFTCGVYSLALAMPARTLYTFNDATLCRALQIMQMAALFPAAAMLASLALELTSMAGVPRSPATTMAAVYAVVVSIELLIAAVRLRRFSAV